MIDAPAQASAPDVDSLIEAVRTAGAGILDAKEAVRARRARAGELDIVAALLRLGEGSPWATRLRAGLQALGVASRSLDASVRWYRTEQRRENGGGGYDGPGDERPAIRVDNAADLHVHVAQALAALEADPALYYREGEFVRVTREPGAEPVIRAHTAATLRVRLTMAARFWKTGETGTPEPCSPPDAITLAILEAGEWDGIRPLVGIAETPFLREDKSLCQRPGYDPATRLLYLPTIEFPQIPDAPTHDDASAALLTLWVETSYDFPFRGLGYAAPDALAADPDGVLRFLAARACPDAWGIVSGILTIVARPAIVGDVPAHIYDASAPGSGKGLQVDVVALSSVGRILPKLTWPTGDKEQTDAEAGKKLDGAVLDGVAIIAWDEIVGAFGGPAINNALTCRGRMGVRPLGQSTMRSVSYRAVMLGAGNNIGCRDNTHRRILMPRLESSEENPEDHKGWRRGRLRESVTERRGMLIAAAITVLRAYVVAGMPATDMPDAWGGGFEAWSELVARAILWAGGGNIMGCRPTADPEARNEERDQMAIILDTVARLEPKGPENAATGEGITIGRMLDSLYTRERLKGEAAPDGYEDAREAIDALTGNLSGRKPNSKRLADRIKVWKRRPMGGRMLETAPKKDSTNVQRWRVKEAR